VVLRGIEHLEERRRRVAAPVGADLVDLVEEDDRVHAAGLLDGAHDAAGQRADVGAPMSPDLGLVPHTAQRDAHERPAHRPGDRLAERRLAHAGRAHEREDGTATAPALVDEAALGPQLAHGEVLDDAVLDVDQPGVVGVEDPARLADVEPVVGADAPRQLGDRVEPGPDPAVLGALLARALQALDLALDRVADRHRDALAPHARAVVVRRRAIAVLAQLLADGGELLAEQVLALRPLHAVGHLGADAVGQLELGQRLAGPPEHPLQPVVEVERLEHLHLALDREVGPRRSGVGQRARIGDPVDELGQPAGAAVLRDHLQHDAQLAGELLGPLARLGLGDGLDLHPQRRAGPGRRRAEAGAMEPAEDQCRGAVRQLAGAVDPRHGADGGEAALDAGDQEERAVGLERSLGRSLGLVRLERKGDHRLRQDHARGEGKQREGDRVDLGGGVGLGHGAPFGSGNALP
jgi:hypothetical protein